jgi:hypothetical protein
VTAQLTLSTASGAAGEGGSVARTVASSTRLERGPAPIRLHETGASIAQGTKRNRGLAKDVQQRPRHPCPLQPGADGPPGRNAVAVAGRPGQDGERGRALQTESV